MTRVVTLYLCIFLPDIVLGMSRWLYSRVWARRIYWIRFWVGLAGASCLRLWLLRATVVAEGKSNLPGVSASLLQSFDRGALALLVLLVVGVGVCVFALDRGQGHCRWTARLWMLLLFLAGAVCGFLCFNKVFDLVSPIMLLALLLCGGLYLPLALNKAE